MIFSLIIIILLGLVAYFHYLQGMFSATISAILAAFASLLAFSFHEPLVSAFLGGKVGNQALALSLMGLFAAIYFILRIVFDKLVPGNVRLPLLMDKIGAAVMGVVAAVFSVGTFAVAAQTLPFGPTIGGYGRYETVGERDAQVRSGGRMLDVMVRDELKNDSFDPGDATRLWVPVDDIFINLVQQASAGSLSGKRTLKSIHPDYLDQLFAGRLGIQVGASKVAINKEGARPQATVDKLFFLDSAPQVDAELDSIRRRSVPPELKPGPGKVLIVARVFFGLDASDKDKIFRFSPGSIRLLLGGKNYYPIGTLEAARFVVSHRMDDFLLVDLNGADAGADLVFEVERSAIPGLGPEPTGRGRAAPPSDAKMPDGAFLEVKRLARVDVSGKAIDPRPVPDGRVMVMRKAEMKLPEGGTKAEAAGDAGSSELFSLDTVTVTPKLFSPINVGPHDAQGRAEATFASGSATIENKKFIRLEVNPVEALQRLRMGDYVIEEFAAPTGAKIVQVKGALEADRWLWATDLKRVKLVLEDGKELEPIGAFARGKEGTADKMVGSFDLRSPPGSVPESGGDFKPTDVWYIFAAPQGSKLAKVTVDGKSIKTLNQTVN
jgi:hypothetical protein